MGTTSNAFVRCRRYLLVALLVYAASLWFVAAPHGIGYSWRECDTQAIARNFLEDGFNPLRPRVDWRGDTDGAVECEFPLYQLMIASVMAVFGDVEWPGRVLAMLAMLMATLSLHRLLELRSGPGGALAGALVFLSGGHAMMLGARVMPDALSLSLGLAGLVKFVRYLSSGNGVSLGLAMSAFALSSLQKPTALQLGLLMFAWTALLAPRRLREPRLWLGFGFVVALVGAWLLHGRSLHEETGLTFGVVSGGDTKFPDLHHLREPTIWLQLARTTMLYGLSVLGAIGLFAMLVRRRLDLADVALFVTVGTGLLVSLRYSYHHHMGPHYHVYAAVAGAWCVSRAWPAQAPRWLWPAALVAVLAHGAWQLNEERLKCEVCAASPMIDIAASIRRLSGPTELTVVASEKTRYDPVWRRTNNFEDPRLLYHAHRHGWVLPSDGFQVTTLENLRSRGARLVCGPLACLSAPGVAAWLAANGEQVFRQGQTVVHRLHTTE
ncbi:MAG: glycosyltransferase family 39 protein [Planctomycetota bacterium]